MKTTIYLLFSYKKIIRFQITLSNFQGNISATWDKQSQSTRVRDSALLTNLEVSRRMSLNTALQISAT